MGTSRCRAATTIQPGFYYQAYHLTINNGWKPTRPVETRLKVRFPRETGATSIMSGN
jgi:hypothetical protein